MESLINQTLDQESQNSAALYLNKPMLRRGSRGEAVVELQRLLAHWQLWRRDRPFDGIFDAEVEAAVKSYQFALFLLEDGIVGNVTWQVLYQGAPINMPILQRGSQGKYVTTLQQTLRNTGDYTAALDGDFGSRTDTAVRVFQRRNNLLSDGIVGNRTWHALSKTRLPQIR